VPTVYLPNKVMQLV